MLLNASDSMGDGVQLGKKTEYYSDDTDNNSTETDADHIAW